MFRIRPIWRSQRGDTLLEVTFALSILGAVLLGATSIAAAAFRTGQTARERTQIATQAQEQMEALRSFRDNHTWAEFRGGNGCGGGGFCGVDQMPASGFYMTLATIGADTEWVPQAGSTTGSVPTSVIQISTSTPNNARDCGYDFLLTYSFDPLGGGPKAINQIQTRLANIKYNPGVGPAVCPL